MRVRSCARSSLGFDIGPVLTHGDAGGTNPLADGRVRRAIGQEFDPARRQSLRDQSAAMLRADVVHLPLHHQAPASAHRDRVQVVQRADDFAVLSWIMLR